MKVYQVVMTAVIVADKDPVEATQDPSDKHSSEHGLFEDMLCSGSWQARAKVIGEVVDVDDLADEIRRRPAKVKPGGAHVAPVEAP